MISTGLLTVFSALAPLSIRQFELSLDASWRVAASLLGLALLLQFLFAARSSTPLREAKLIGPIRFEWFLAAISVGLIIALVAVSLGFFVGSLQALYSLGLLFLLALGSHHFLNLILAAQPSRNT